MALFHKKYDMEFINFIILVLYIVSLPVLSLISFIIFIPIFLISCFFTSYGKFISCTDSWLEEEFINNIPGYSIVITMAFQRDQKLNELRHIFTNNVLEARSKVNPKKLRYPELKQYLSTLFCFRIWKNDPNFRVDEHIIELNLDNCQDDEIILENLHNKYLNMPYKKHKSPWELVLVRKINLNESKNEQKFFIVFRVHHVMADAKSVVKLLVECLGNKKLKTADFEAYGEKTFLSKLKFILGYPTNCISALANFWALACQNFQHPYSNILNYGSKNEQNLKMVVAFSPKLEMSQIKKVGSKYNVKTSAVVMSIVTGTIRKFTEDKWNKGVISGWALAKPNHPEFLTNHLYGGYLSLPTNESCGRKRLEICNQEFLKIKSSEQFRYTYSIWSMGGSLVYPISRLTTTLTVPIGISNNAGEKEGFSVGNAECQDFRMSVGTSHRAYGLIFCTISYKDGLRIAVIAKESIIKKEIAEDMTQHLAKELKLLEK